MELKNYHDLIDNDTIVVGCSAGPDSMCLLHLLKEKTNYNIICCHINHNVRKQSIEEEEYLKKYCQEKNITFECYKITNWQENNFENEARKKRYKFYEEILNKYHTKYLFLAHHGDDLIETILMKISRGSNIEGYLGIKEVSYNHKYYIIRPLLYYTKEDIIKYNQDHNIKYYIDNTNTDTNYTRNRYRKNILPLLKKEDKDIHKKFLTYSKTLEEYDNYIKRYITSILPNIYIDNYILIDKFNREDIFIRRNILYMIINNLYDNKPNNITDNHIKQILNIINSTKPNQTINLPNNKLVKKEYNKLYFIKNSSKNVNYNVLLEDTIIINNFTISKIDKEISKSNYIMRLNSKDITLPLYIRNRKEGDYIELKGLNGKKKIKEIFINEKIPASLRDSYPLLVDSKDQILWVPGLKKSKYDIENNEKYDIILKCYHRKEDKYES